MLLARRQETPLEQAGAPRLIRVLGRGDLTCQTVNLIIGSAIFVVPGITLADMGGWAPLAVLATAAGVLTILLTFAEAGGRYEEPGGLYRYTADAFGEFVGAQVGLLYWVVRVTAAAAVANVFVIYLGEIWTAAAHPGWRAALLSVGILGCGWINIRGTRGAASVVNGFAIAKLLPLIVLVGVGVFAISGSQLTAAPLPGTTAWARAILLWVFAFGGFEAILIPAAEARNPTTDGPRALLGAFAIVTVIYVLVQLVVAGTLSGDVSESPVSQSAQIVLGSWGAMLVVVGALVSTSGGIAGSILATARITFAIAERGGLPRVLARVHPRFKTPDASIALFTLATWILALAGSFAWNAAISAIARLIVYAVCAVAVLRLRRFGPSSFSAPVPVHVAAAAFCTWLFFHQTLGEAVALAAVLAGTSVTWVVCRLLR